MMPLYYSLSFCCYLFVFWFWGHTRPCLGLIPSSALRLLLVGLWELYVLSGIEFGLVICKASALPTILYYCFGPRSLSFCTYEIWKTFSYFRGLLWHWVNEGIYIQEQNLEQLIFSKSIITAVAQFLLWRQAPTEQCWGWNWEHSQNLYSVQFRIGVRKTDNEFTKSNTRPAQVSPWSVQRLCGND